MKLLALLAVVLPTVSARASMVELNNLVKRAACQEANIVTGVSSISSSAYNLWIVGGSNAVPPPGTCTKVTNVASILLSIKALNSRISSEAVAVGGCSPGIGACNSFASALTSKLIPIAGSIRAGVINHSSLICCSANVSGNLAGQVRAQGSSIRATLAIWSASLNTKLPCPAVLSAGVSSLYASVDAVIKTISC